MTENVYLNSLIGLAQLALKTDDDNCFLKEVVDDNELNFALKTSFFRAKSERCQAKSDYAGARHYYEQAVVFGKQTGLSVINIKEVNLATMPTTPLNGFVYYG